MGERFLKESVLGKQIEKVFLAIFEFTIGLLFIIHTKTLFESSLHVGAIPEPPALINNIILPVV